jgi:hypothetical protein
MNRRKTQVVVLLIGLFGVCAAGCGDNILTATQKFLAGQFCQLSATEIKALNQTAQSVLAGQNPPITIPLVTDAQATAISDFLRLNSVCSVAAIENLPNLVDQGQQLQGVSALATAFGVDPASINIRQIVQMLRQYLGAGATGGSTSGAGGGT